MDGENNGKPYFLMDDLGVPLFWETPIVLDIIPFNRVFHYKSSILGETPLIFENPHIVFFPLFFFCLLFSVFWTTFLP